MKIKVCGMKHPENIQQLIQLPIDFMGLIFYSKSPRYVVELNPKHLSNLPSHIKKVGVFVNAELQEVENRVKEYSLDYVQLHGKETVEYIKELRIKVPNLRIIKAFSIAEIEDIEKTEEYEEVCDYLLFDTKTPQHGGSGKKFDWTILNNYKGETPFFLSGGISLEDTEEIQKIQHKKLYALDLNSKFELKPGLKDIKQLDKFLNKIKRYNQ
ncbi:phosphoribosylanthranilate isomerase [Apibacter muscae]|uniref:N-(5'-phosphoribosyl)anthranilate isomerase n=1 Tax=Apibacter muscae TaxID=2509004 RepID=A0A563DKB2_9FLAO|nr:phosphoribosylanthranilate isomerase [Apibacter muscae]TWP30597.1 phosphoribosylanthranilate isomerase [Apibacter muscae]